MDIYYIKAFALIILFLGCIVATYTDIKDQIIPNYLTFSMIIIGICIVSSYFILKGSFSVFYYISIVLVFILSYILWIIGLWGGGDVKLLTAISTLLTYDFLGIIPSYHIFMLQLPVYSKSFIVPTLWVIINSVLSILPIIITVVIYEIIKNKRYLIGILKNSFKINEVLFNLNVMICLNYILSILYVDNIMIKLVVIAVTLMILNKLIQNYIKYAAIITTILIVIVKVIGNDITSYILTILIFEAIVIFITITQNNLLSDVLSDDVDIDKLDEGMILTYPLYKVDDEYIFKSQKLADKLTSNNKDIVVESNIMGITKDDIENMQKLRPDKIDGNVKIKKTLSFAPFILAGLIITVLFGDMFYIIKLIIGVVIGGL